MLKYHVNMKPILNTYLYIEPYVHIEITKNEALLYNTLNKTHTFFSEKEIIPILKELAKTKNLRLVILNNHKIKAQTAKKFTEVLISNCMGDQLLVEESFQNPVQIPPFLKIEEYIPDPRKDSHPIISNSLINLVNELSIFINNDRPPENRIFFEKASKQYLTIKKDNNYEEIGLDSIKACINTFAEHCLNVVNILGGDIFKHSNFSSIVSYLNILPCWKRYYCYFKDFTEKHYSFINEIDTKSTLHLVFNNICNERGSIENLIKLYVSNPNIEYDFYIDTFEEIDEFQRLQNLLKFENINLFPFYSGDNLDFIETTLTFSEDMVFSADISMKEILIRGRLNEHFYGKLFVLSNGMVHSNLNEISLGNIHNNAILKMIFKEVNQTLNWSLTRNNVNPCSLCLLKSLCPPISNLELHIKKFNFCNQKFNLI